MNKFAVILLAVIGCVFIVVGLFALRYYTAPIRGQVEQQERVHSGEFRLYSYEHFYNMYGNIKAYEDQIRNQKELLGSLDNKEEKEMYRRNINALKNQRASAIREYNAEAMKEGSRGQFKANDLPSRIEVFVGE